jgi:hypothetical protein
VSVGIDGICSRMRVIGGLQSANHPSACVMRDEFVIDDNQDHIVAHAAAAALSLTWIASSKRLEESVARRPVTAAVVDGSSGVAANSNTLTSAVTSRPNTAAADHSAAALQRPKTSYTVIKPGSPAQVSAFRCYH